MRHEFEKGKKALLAGLEAEKENLHSEEGQLLLQGWAFNLVTNIFRRVGLDNGVPLAYSVTVKCVHGPYEGTEFTMTIDAVRKLSPPPVTHRVAGTRANQEFDTLEAPLVVLRRPFDGSEVPTAARHQSPEGRRAIDHTRTGTA